MAQGIYNNFNYRALACLELLLEGLSIRSTERITGIHRDTILKLLGVVGNKCQSLFDKKISSIPVREIQADEIWSFVFCKEKHKKANHIKSDKVGDAYCFVAMDRNTKLIVAWHLGRRTTEDTEIFTEKLNQATTGRFQLTTDGMEAYPDAVSLSLGTRVDYAQVIKTYQYAQTDRKYSPSTKTLNITKRKVIGKPKLSRATTSHIERQNLTMRMTIRRLTRLTNAYSKKWENLNHALAIYFAYYNFCRSHSSIRCTPAMAAKVTNHIWELEELLY